MGGPSLQVVGTKVVFTRAVNVRDEAEARWGRG